MEAPLAQRSRRRWRRAGATVAFVVALGCLAFVLNATWPTWKQPWVRVHASPPAVESRELRVLAFNLQKLDLFRGGSVRSPEEVRAQLDEIAALIRAHDPHLVALSEVVVECALCPVDQVEHLARATGMHQSAFGEQFDFGVPGCAIRGGNALLSRLPLRGVRNEQLSGGASFLWPANNRRALWCEALVAGRWLPVGSLHLDSFDPQNNLRQAEQLVAGLPEGSVLLAGDFNARPESATLERLLGSKRFAAPAAELPPSFPARDPDRRLDYVLAPRGWRLVREQVISSTLSDHRPVIATFALPATR